MLNNNVNQEKKKVENKFENLSMIDNLNLLNNNLIRNDNSLVKKKKLNKKTDVDRGLKRQKLKNM